LLAIGLTVLLVQSGFDWIFFSVTRRPVLLYWVFSAAPIGGLVPLILPLILLIVGLWPGRTFITKLGWAIAQAELIGSMISWTYKAFTGRVHPPIEAGPDISHDFHFGFLRGFVFWGWPSHMPPLPWLWRSKFSPRFPAADGWEFLPSFMHFISVSASS
jgi:hypothetical protein